MPQRGPVPVKLFKKEEAEILRVGPLTIRVYEDGSLTENRVSGVLLEVPAGKSGPPMHWHRFHDELFLVTKGTLRFVTPDGHIDAKAGDLMTVPPRAIHTFKNPSETEDCECYMTATPGHYVDYFRMLSKATAEGIQLSPSDTQHLMSLFGTFPPDVDSEP
ncbi:RmlC-like cupin domain-containing protein [Lasiosphaeris hirsuta]|uniref:RmlC-like cupin domain-containing protein n=1 Tax=Lasiosphaeris hirsuta TaxID=260670 RepID=A0AA40DPR2_9PEZI|nr:RmlC-like cupin domain-containing protein [Lasiosphaeris hirsuta]